MGAAGARRWKLLLPFRSPAAAAPKLKPRPPEVAVAPSPVRKEQEEEVVVPGEFLCPILGAPMADPVILPSGRTYERACVEACAELGLSPLGPDGVMVGAPPGDGAAPVAIPNDALRAAVRTWCARSGRAAPVAPSPEKAREAVLRAAPARSASSLSCSSSGTSASASTTSKSSSAGSAAEMAVVEVVVLRGNGKEAVKEGEQETLRIDEAEEEVVAKAVERGDTEEVEAAMAALRRATREGAARRRALCAPRLLAALRRVLLSSRHTASARADAAAALANLSLEPENRVPIVRAGAVPALIEALASGAEACEHAAGALFGLALHEGNRAAVGVLGAVPPLLAVLADRGHAPRARRDAGMALYHLSLAAVNQSKLARAPGAARSLLTVASDAAEPSPIRRLALMVACNLAACAEGRSALMDAGAVAAVSAILSGDARASELQQWCVAALYGMSRGSPRFRGLARAAGADRPLTVIAEHTLAGVHKEMAQTLLRTMLGLCDDNDGGMSECRNSEINYGGGGSTPAPPHRRRAASWGAPPAAPPQPNAHQWRTVCID
ncbi:hypothetical protein ACP70R_000775 [Stipagrostis hirtigluma subsp. patula]